MGLWEWDAKTLRGRRTIKGEKKKGNFGEKKKT